MKTCVKLLLVVAVLLTVGCSRLGRTAEEMRQTIARADSMNKAYVPMDSLGEQLQAAVDYYDRHGTANEQVRAHYLLGCAYRDRGEAPEALQHYHDAADRADTTAADCDFALLARVHGQMADIFYEVNLPHEALDQLSLQSLYGKLAKDTFVWVNAYSQRSSVFDMMDVSDSAISIGEKSYRLYNAFGYHQTAAQSLGTLIYYLIGCRRYSEAEQYIGIYEAESGYFHEGRIAEGLELYYYLKGAIALGGKRYGEAEKFFRSLVEEGTDANSREAAYKGLVDLFTETGKSDSVAKYAILSYKTCNESFRETATDEVRHMQSLYNYSRHQHIAQVKTEEAARNMVLLFLTFLLFIITILIADYAYRRKKRQQRDELERLRTQFSHDMAALEQAQHDLYSIKENELASLIDEKTAAIAQLQKRLSMANEESLTNNSICQALHHIARTPKSEPSRAQWQELHDLVSRELPAFYGIVNGGKRRLTDEEYRICMLTRLGFSVTEISLLTGETVKVLATKRARLLKKIFGIEGGAETFDQRIREIFADATD